MPSSLKAGDKLNDGSLVITVSSSGMKMMTMKLSGSTIFTSIK